jgi:hypothetical protein
VPWGPPHAERADAARDWAHLLATARQMLAEQGPDTLTMSVPATTCLSCSRLTLLRPTPSMRPSARAAAIAASWSSKRASTRPPPGKLASYAAASAMGEVDARRTTLEYV